MSRPSSGSDNLELVATPRWASALARILDTAYFIPGTRVRIGIDAVLGFLVPGVGDAATALATAAFIWVGFRRGVPKVILLRMLLNLAIDAALGAIPFVGDLFDVFHRAAAKNLELLRQHAVDGHRANVGDYAVVIAILAGLGVVLVIPLVLLAGLIVEVVSWVGR